MGDAPIRCLLVTGGCGFIGSHFVRYVRQNHPGIRVICYDLLTYAGSLGNVSDLRRDPLFEFIQGDIADPAMVDHVLQSYSVDGIVNFAAETHVDRSITGPAEFVRTNIVGTATLLDAARKHGVSRFCQISTDEVYGSLTESDPSFCESSPLKPSSPYSASKCAADLLALAYHRTYGLPVVITRCSNNYGPAQFPEKLIPVVISKLLHDDPVPVYGQGQNIRDWIYVGDHVEAVWRVLEGGRPGEVYNIGANCEKRNLEIVRELLTILGKPESMIQYVQDRPGHDWRYAMNPTRIERELGWTAKTPFTEGLRKTVEWYRERDIP
jgi:dTDP-glucose 4,6-dehydratase